MANVSYGPRGLELIAEGRTAEETIQELVAADEGREDWQVGVVDARGKAATFTGNDCFSWAGGFTGEHYAAQGNILVGEETVRAMARVYEDTGGDLAGRLLAALDAGQEAGGDSRGRQSAALLVVREAGGYGGQSDRVVDLRVDDHADPIKELIRIRELHTLYFGETEPDDVVAEDGDVRDEVVASLIRLGYLEDAGADDEKLYGALGAFIGTENFEEREQERGYLDRQVLEFLRGKQPGA